ncbi:MAG: S8 family peptidase [bacterium JZ-2024 1]
MKKEMWSAFFLIAVGVGVFLFSGCGGLTSSPEEGLSGMEEIEPTGITLPVEPYLPDEILVKFKEGVPASLQQEILQRLGALPVEKISQLATLRVKIPSGQVESFVRRFQELAEVEYAEPNYTRQAMVIPNDTYFNLQWGFHNTGQSSSCFAAGTVDADIDGPEAWDISAGSADVKIAVLDTGIQSNHPDLSGKVVLAKSFVGGNANDGHGHGTHVAGIASALSNNSRGVAGTCWNCKLMNGKVLNNSGSGSCSTSSNGIIWAADNGAKVVNMSYGSTSLCQTEQNAVNYAWNKGVVLVAAAGNNNSTTKFYPAAHSNVIAVAATTNKDQKASFSNYGSWVHVASPGYCIASTYKNSSYAWMSGTSQASPFVAGLAALIFSKFPSYTNAQVRDKIFSSTENIPGTGTYWIYGRINAQKALQ